MRKMGGVLMLLFCAVMAGGCWDRLDIEKRIIVQGIAMDDHPSGLELTIQISNGKRNQSQQSGSPAQPAQQTVSGTGKTVNEALEELQYKLSGRLHLGHVRVLLFGEKMARKGEEKIKKMLDGLHRNSEVRRLTWMLVTEGKAKDILSNQTTLKVSTSEFLDKLLEAGVEAEKIPNLRLGDFFINSLNPGEVPVLNLVKRTGEELIWNGIAVIQDGKWLGTLGRDETFFLMHIRFNQLGGDVHVPCPGKEGYLVFQPDRMKSEIDVKEGQTAHINLTQTIHGRLIERSCFIDLGSKTVEKMAEHLIENHYERHATKLLDKLQHHMKVDALQLGSHVHAFAPSLWEKADWKQTFSRMPIRVHYRVYVDRIGSIAK